MAEKPAESSGLRMVREEAPEIAPPGAVSGEETPGIKPPEGEAPGEKLAQAGMVPLHPAFVRLPLRAEGAILHQFTGFAGWEYDEATLNDLAEMSQTLGIELNPLWQFIIALLSVHAVKVLGYVAWKRAGKPKSEEIKEEAK